MAGRARTPGTARQAKKSTSKFSVVKAGSANVATGNHTLRYRISRLLAALALGTLLSTPASGQTGARQIAVDTPLVTDLSTHLIAITSSFSGTELLVFGALDAEGDVIVAVRGPAGPVNIRKKEQVAGIWLNRRSLRFDNVPTFYAVAANRPLSQIASSSLLSRLQIGAGNLRLVAEAGATDQVVEFRDAIVRNKERDGLYLPGAGTVTMLGGKLFRTGIELPANVPVGTYRAEVYLIRDDRVIAAQATPLFVDKQGVEQEVYDFAHQQPLLYGLAAVAIALGTGWAAGLLFRRT